MGFRRSAWREDGVEVGGLQSLDKRRGQVGVGWAKLEGRGKGRRSGGTCRSSLPQLGCHWPSACRVSALWPSQTAPTAGFTTRRRVTGASASRGATARGRPKRLSREPSNGSRASGRARQRPAEHMLTVWPMPSLAMRFAHTHTHTCTAPICKKPARDIATIAPLRHPIHGRYAWPDMAQKPCRSPKGIAGSCRA